MCEASVRYLSDIGGFVMVSSVYFSVSIHISVQESEFCQSQGPRIRVRKTSPLLDIGAVFWNRSCGLWRRQKPILELKCVYIGAHDPLIPVRAIFLCYANTPFQKAFV